MSANPIEPISPGWPVAAIDLHQHLWPEPFVDRLRARSRTPYLRGWTLFTHGEAPYEIEPAHHDVTAAAARERPGRHRPRVPVPLGAARDRVAARTLGGRPAGRLARGRGRAAVRVPCLGVGPSRSIPTSPALAAMLADGLVGVQVPGHRRPDAVRLGAARPGARRRRAGRQARARAPRAGRRRRSKRRPCRRGGRPSSGTPRQLQAAWWAWHAGDVRASHPTLRVVFAAGAGLAPVHHERHVARGGTSGARRPARPRRHVVVRAAGSRRPRPGARDRRAGARQRPAVRRADRGADGRRGHPRGARHQPAAGCWRLPVTRAGEGCGHGRERELTVRERLWTPLPRAGTSSPRSCAELVVSLAARSGAVGRTWSASTTTSGCTPRCTATPTWTSGCCAGPRSTTPGWHDHDISSGAVAVVAGELVENNLLRSGRPVGRPGSARARRSRSAPTTSTGSTAPCAARSPCTPTARRCGGWASTPSTTTACCAGCRCRTPTSCARSSDARGGHQPQEPGTPLKGPTTRLVTQPP